MNLNKHKMEEEKMDMTPMIDVVFLLIIFFMLISDMTQQDLEILTLPKAISAVPDEPDVDDFRPVINVRQDGAMVVMKEEVFVPNAESSDDDEAELERTLLNIATRMKKDYFDPENPSAGTGKKDLPDDFLLIRADQYTSFHFIQRIMTLAGHESVKIWKIQLAAGTIEDEKKPK
jgi:biopolymer transport protein ExbD